MMITVASKNKCGCSLTMVGDKVTSVDFCLEHLHLSDPLLTLHQLHKIWIALPDVPGPLPESLPEKRADDTVDKNGLQVFPHWMFVHELRALLDELEDDDWLTPNANHDLVVDREVDGKYTNGIAVINFFWTHVDWYDGRNDEEE